MLKKENRLKKRKSFAYIHNKGKRVGNDVLTLAFVNANVREVKIGFSVSKKVGNSVVRHRAIRKMRAVARELLPQIDQNNTIIFTAKEGIDKKSNQEIKDAMTNVLSRARILK